MTTILYHPSGYLLADRIFTYGSTAMTADKIVRLTKEPASKGGGVYAVGCGVSGQVAEHINWLAKRPRLVEDFPESITPGECQVFTFDSKKKSIHIYDGTYTPIKLDNQEVILAGSGAQFVQGWLAALSYMGKQIELQDLVSAITHVIGAPHEKYVQVVRLW